MFRSLSGYNYRLWFLGLLVSNIGTWMQRTAQDWIVLTELTENNATAVGVTMALQFGPQLLLVPLSGLIADRLDRRRLLLVTQISSAATSLALGLLVVTGTVELWHVFALAGILGVTSALDAPARQTFVSELVDDRDLPNAVALNAASFNSARLVGPAAAGLLIALVGTGWVFLINTVTFAAVLGALLAMRRSELRPAPRAGRARGQIAAGFRYVRSRSDIVVILVMVFLLGTFGLNFPVFLSTMTTVVFDEGSTAYGLLSSVMAIGSVAAALLAARRQRPRMRVIVLASAGFGVSATAAAFAPTYPVFAVCLVAVGFCSLSMMTSANAYVQTTTDAIMRGRVMALYMAIFLGGTPIGAPLIGWVADAAGPRTALGIGAASGLAGAAVAVFWLLRYRGVRVAFSRRHLPRVVAPIAPATIRGRGPAAPTGEIAVAEAAHRVAS